MPSIVITGCSSGFGRATVGRFLAHQWGVFATVRREADRDALAEEARASGSAGQLTVVLADITRAADVERLRAAVAGTPVAMLVNNAGTAHPGPLELLPLDELRAQLEINVVAQLAVTQAVLPSLKAARGTIVNVSSISGRIASPAIGAYSASKFALEALSDSLRVELAPFSVRVVVVEPGSSNTHIWETSIARVDVPAMEQTVYAPLLTAMREHAAKEAAAGFPPEQFADLAWKIASSASPRTRYALPGHIRRVIFLRRLLTDRFFDREIRRILRW